MNKKLNYRFYITFMGQRIDITDCVEIEEVKNNKEAEEEENND